jgi:hypothetical protein
MGAEDPDGWGIVWPNLEQLSLKAQAELEEIITRTDTTRIDQGMDPMIIFTHRYGEGEYRTTPPMLTTEQIDDMATASELDKEPVGDEPEPGVTPPALAPFAAKTKAAAEEPDEGEPEDDEV